MEDLEEIRAIGITQNLVFRRSIRCLRYNLLMSKRTGRYQINEKDIDSVIRYLKTIDQEHATPEMAIAILERLQETYHTMAHQDPEMLQKIYDELIRQKKAKN